MNKLPETGLLRQSEFVGRGKAIPVSRATWWRGVRKGHFPQPIQLAPNMKFWRAEDIHQLINEGVVSAVEPKSLSKSM